VTGARGRGDAPPERELPTGVPILSVVIPTKDRPETLGALVRALDAVAQTEVIVVDDGSGEEGRRSLSELSRNHGCSVLTCGRGVGAARNLGIAAARGRWAIFIDDDDSLGSGFAHIPQLLEECTADAMFFKWREQTSHTSTSRGPSDLGPAFRHLMGSVLAGSFALRVSVARQVGGYDEALRFSENTELLMRVSSVDRLTSDVSDLESVVVHRRDPSLRESNRPEHVLEAVQLILRKHEKAVRSDPEMTRNYLRVATRNAAELHRFRTVLKLQRMWLSWALSVEAVARPAAYLARGAGRGAWRRLLLRRSR
jgi:hypothetical protein